MPLFKRSKKEEKQGDPEQDKQKGSKKLSMKELYQKDPQGAKKKKKEVTTSGKTETSQKDTSAQEIPVSERTVKHGQAYRVLIKPLITEKGGNLGVQGKYLFQVSDNANKIEVAQAIREVYGIKPVKVNLFNVKGKRVRFGRIFGKRKDWKKAVVTLPKGKSINVYEGV